MKRVFRINTGSCGACDVHIDAAVLADADLCWADSPQNADALLLTGPITHASKAPLLQLLHDIGNIPLLAVGRCAIDGHPFGKGGVQGLEGVVVHVLLDGCPPVPQAIAEVIRKYIS